MNRLIGKKVLHKDLGEGVITKTENTEKGIFISVDFPETKEAKRYGFPVAVGKSLSSEDKELLSIAEETRNAIEEAKRIAEEKRLTEEEKKLKKLSDEAIQNAKSIIEGADKNKVFSEGNYKIFKVHQGKTFGVECVGGYVWAPESGIHHHEKMTEIKTGDILFHYANGAMVAVGEAVSDCFNYPQPAALYGHGWGTVGYRVEVRYQVFYKPFPLDPYKMDIINNRASSYSSFDSNGDACQGYMYELELDIAKLLKKEILKTVQPVGVENVLNRIK